MNSLRSPQIPSTSTSTSSTCTKRVLRLPLRNDASPPSPTLTTVLDHHRRAPMSKFGQS